MEKFIFRAMSTIQNLLWTNGIILNVHLLRVTVMKSKYGLNLVGLTLEFYKLWKVCNSSPLFYTWLFQYIRLASSFFKSL